ncbi:HEPN domain-containing protein [Micromonospora sp. NPDC049044]|uniref:HEPN domain-containing protein n=1 Tax=Micromonospora sp. NPDC049044 TaxID=3154827 RepID=UPI003405E28C
MSESTSPPNDEFARNVVNSIFDVFVEPELSRRGLTLERDAITKVVVEIDPGRKHPRVWINDQAQISVQVRASKVEEGQSITEADVEEVIAVLPPDVGPNSGYVCLATIAGARYVTFDFRYNREQASGLIQRAEEFLAVARTCSETAPAVACDVAYSAAELTVQASMLLQQQRTKNHSYRQEWLDQWVAHANAPSSHAETLRALHRARAAARYADGSLDISDDELKQLLGTVSEMIAYARSRAA